MRKRGCEPGLSELPPVWMPASRRARVFAALASFLTLAGGSAAAGCERPPSADSLQEWSPADHHSTDDDKLGGRGPAPGQAGAAARRGGEDDVAQLVDLAWRQQCTNCHGSGGHGDGQMGPMLHAPDLTLADWQSQVTDAEVALIIKSGKNRMPKFDLPDPVLQGLVARIRSLRER